MKLDRIEQDIEKVREKMTLLGAQLKELENQKEEAENLQVIQLVRSYKLNHTELMAFLRSKQPHPAQRPMPQHNPIIKEDDDHEEN